LKPGQDALDHGLHYAAGQGKVQRMNQLIDKGAVANENTLNWAANARQHESIALLLKKFPKLDTKSAAYESIMRGDPKSLKALLDHGANPAAVPDHVKKEHGDVTLDDIIQQKIESTTNPLDVPVYNEMFRLLDKAEKARKEKPAATQAEKIEAGRGQEKEASKGR